MNNLPTCVLWCDYITFEQIIRIGFVRYFESIGEFNIVGITCNDGIYKSICGCNYIFKDEIKVSEIDYVIVLELDNEFKKIRYEILSKGFSDNAIIPFKSMTLDGFTLQKYIKLKEDVPSIFASNCWGGITYHNLGLPFISPTINMFFDEKDYLKFLKNPKHYFEMPLTFHSTEYNAEENMNYPVAKCDDILLYFNHYTSLEIAEECWRKRIQRINWDNIFAMMWTDNPDTAAEFSSLSYEKKICFVSFPTEDESLCYIDYLKKIPECRLWQMVLGLARDKFHFYDVFDMLSKGKITKTIITM